MTSLQPVAWFKFDESSGTVAHDSTGANDGTYMPGDPAATDGTPLLGVSGAVNDNSTAAHFGTLDAGTPSPVYDAGVYRGSYMTAPDNGAFSMKKGGDTLERDASASTSWGTPTTPDGAGTWSAVSSIGNFYSTASGYPSLASGGAIDETVATGTFGQKFPAIDRLDTDSQVEVSWDNTGHNATTTGSFQPVILASRFADANNFYAAQLQETNGVIKLSVLKRVSAVTTTFVYVQLATSFDYTVRWRVRFQIDSDRTVTPAVPRLRAKAWKSTDPQPTGWSCATCVSATESGTPLAAAGNAILSSNSSTNNHSIIRYNNYSLQSTGFTVSAWMRPTTEFFTSPAGILCGSTQANYAQFVTKQDPGAAEWALRHYPETAIDTSCGENRKWALSAYAFSLTPTDPVGNPNNRGAGDRFNPTAALTGWHHVVAIYDPGDYFDTTAGVTQCVDGTCYPKTITDGGTSGPTNYAAASYQVDPGNGTAPFRAGAAYPSVGTWQQFQGDLDEISVYDYRLTAQNVADMYSYKK